MFLNPHFFVKISQFLSFFTYKHFTLENMHFYQFLDKIKPISVLSHSTFSDFYWINKLPKMPKNAIKIHPKINTPLPRFWELELKFLIFFQSAIKREIIFHLKSVTLRQTNWTWMSLTSILNLVSISSFSLIKCKSLTWAVLIYDQNSYLLILKILAI